MPHNSRLQRIKDFEEGKGKKDSERNSGDLSTRASVDMQQTRQNTLNMVAMMLDPPIHFNEEKLPSEFPSPN